MPRPLLLAVLLLIAPLTLFASLLCGSLDLTASQVMSAILTKTPGLAHDVVWELRMPRSAGAFICGGLLALSGTYLQVLLRNPLADPYILGISGGAAVGALAAIILGMSWGGVNLSALLGAVAAITVVFGLSMHSGSWNVHSLLLTGVVLSAGFSALISLLLVLAPAAEMRGMLFWLLGDLSHAENILPYLAVLLILSALSQWQAGSLNVLNLGQLKARTLGVAVLPLQTGIYFCSALATVCAVMLGGTVGFVGLIIPHLIRLCGVADHRWLLPMAILLGGSFLTAADTLARTLWAPNQLPVGVLTALLGVPAMLLLLSRKR
ncbi:MAG TPA: iron ABC transporter permease [Burkholderiales bacterium]|nr:iron ABC transporter permease [Burkholderiales bacterium]